MEHMVFPAYDDNDKVIKGMFTIGVPIQALSGSEFRALLRKKISEKPT
jgi:hypothetical protein